MHVSINTAAFLDQMNAGKSQYEVIQQLVGLPIDNVEVRGEFFKGNRDAELQKIREFVNKNDWGLYYSVPEAFFNDGNINVNIPSYVDMAKKFGIKNLKFSLGDYGNITDDKIAVIQKIVDSLGSVTISVENEPNDHGHVSKIHNFLSKVNGLGYTFDSGNWYWINEDPQDAMDDLNSFITIFHLKNIKNRDTTMLDDGDTDWKKLTNKVVKGIPVFIEYNIPSKDLLKSEINKVNALL